MENLDNYLKKSNSKKKAALFIFCNIFAIGLLLLISLCGLSFVTSPNFLGTENSTVEYAEAGGDDQTLTLNTNGGAGGTTGNLTYHKDNQATGRGGGISVGIKDSNGTYVYSFAAAYNMNTGGSNSCANTGISCPSRTGYTFGGYFSNTNGTGTKYIDANGKLADDQGALYYGFSSSTATAYAHWIANTYYVAFNGNGNTGGSTATQTFTYDTAQNLNANGFSKTGHTFDGWATSATEAVAYSNSQNVKNLSTTNGETVTLYAHWAANTYTVTFNGNGATSGSTTNQSFTYGTAQYLNANGFSRNGYTFDGWATSSGGSVAYSNSKSVNNLTTTAGGTVTLYAHWSPIPYTLSFNSNGGSSAASKGVTYNAQIGSLPTPTKLGHTFNGWKIGTTAIYNSTTWTYTSDQTATAQWTQNSYSLTINYGNGAANGSQSVVYGQNVTLSTPSRTGYTFAGWTLNGVGGVNSSFTYNYETNKTVTAQWNKNTYYVAFNGNGYTGGSTATQTFTYDTAQALRTNGFTRTGYTFAGWATTENGNVAYSNSKSVSNLTTTANGTVTLFAKWSPITYTVQFSGNGSSSGSMNSQEFTYDVSKSLTSNAFSKTGHSFAGWATTANGNVAHGNGASVRNLTTTPNGTVTLFAKWSQNTFTMKFNGNGNTGGNTANKTLTYGSSGSLTANGFTKTGYNFKNWNTKADGTGTPYSNNASLTAEHVNSFYNAVGNGGTYTLYAQWTPVSFTLSFSPNESSSTKKVRYIKDFLSGNTSNGSSHFIEIQAFDANGTNVALNKKSDKQQWKCSKSD